MRSPQHQRGVAAIEFGLLLPVLLVLMFGTTELGRAIYTYNTLDKAVRDAARHLSQHGPGEANIQAEARCLAVYGKTVCGGNALAPGLEEDDVVLCDALSCAATHAAQATGSGVVNLVSVSIQNYEFSSAVTWVIPDLDFNAISATMRAQL